MKFTVTTIRITENELARDTHAVLAKVKRGAEVSVEENGVPIAVIAAPKRSGRKLSECLALAKGHEATLGYAPTPDPDFANDVRAAIAAHRQAFRPFTG